MTTQNLTVSLDAKTIRNAKRIAASRGTSVSRLVADMIERLTGEDEAYQAAMRDALALLENGLNLGGTHQTERDALHDRAALR